MKEGALFMSLLETVRIKAVAFPHNYEGAKYKQAGYPLHPQILFNLLQPKIEQRLHPLNQTNHQHRLTALTSPLSPKKPRLIYDHHNASQ